tara:strand:- start:1 stop:453 length:453 start_codon:yes stop_codon:yes gene_type:complete
MNNFDLTKYLAEGKLLKENTTKFQIHTVEPENLELGNGFLALDIDGERDVKEQIQDSIYQTFEWVVDEVYEEVEKSFQIEEDKLDKLWNDNEEMTDDEFDVLNNDLQERIKNFRMMEEYEFVEIDMNNETFSVTNPLTDETRMSGTFSLY